MTEHVCCPILKFNLSLPGAVALKLAQDDNRNSEQELRKDKRSLKVRLCAQLYNLIDQGKRGAEHWHSRREPLVGSGGVFPWKLLKSRPSKTDISCIFRPLLIRQV